MKTIKQLFIGLSPTKSPKTEEESDVTSNSQGVKTFKEKKSGKLFIGNFKLVSEIGSGKFATVVLARDEITNALFAMKIVLKTQQRTSKLKAETDVLETLRTRKHKFIVDFHSVFQTNGHICFIMEYLDGGTILQHLRCGIFDENKARFYTACILLAIGHLHSLNICHKDVKPQNMVLNKEGYVKLIDFGHALTGITFATPLSNKLGTKRYKSPEHFEGGPVYRFTDFWALFVSMHLMLTGKHVEINPQIKTKAKHLSPLANDLLNKIFLTDPFQRLGSSERGAKDIMEHSFFTSINWEHLLDGKIQPPKIKSQAVFRFSPGYIFDEVKSFDNFVDIGATNKTAST